MQPGIAGLDPDDIAVEIERNLCEFSLYMGSGTAGITYDGPDVKWSHTGVSVSNRVLAARFAEDDADARIEDVAREFTARRAPMLWIVGPTSEPADLTRRLVRKGFSPFMDWSGMAADLRAMPDDSPTPDGLTITEVTDPETMLEWSRVCTGGFGIPEHTRQVFHDLFAGLSNGPGTCARHYLGLVDGAPATACTIYNGSTCTGIYLVATLPDFRRRGLAAAITLHAMRESIPWGHRLVVLQASAMGALVYPTIGYEEFCRFALLGLKPL